MAESIGDADPDVPYFHRSVLFEIVVRLPVADVIRCRLVCPEWRHMIDAKDFRLAYARRRSPMVLYFYRRDFALGPSEPGLQEDTARVEVQALDLAARESRLVVRFADAAAPMDGVRDFWVEGSCDGILLISCDQRLYACNPSTHLWARLPPVHLDRRIAGFYTYTPAGEATQFRLLFRTGEGAATAYSILVLGTREERSIGRPMSPRTSPDLDTILMKGLRAYDDPPIVIGDRLYWRHQSNYHPHLHVIEFHIEAEVFDWIASPMIGTPVQGADGNWQQSVGIGHLLEMDGKLAMAVFDPESYPSWSMMEVWIYSNEAWSRCRQIILPLPELAANDVSIIAFEDPLIFVVHSNRRLHVVAECPANILLHCDPAGEVLGHYWRPQHYTVATRHLLQESLAKHAFLRFHGDEIDEEGDGPPFRFQGLGQCES